MDETDRADFTIRMLRLYRALAREVDDYLECHYKMMAGSTVQYSTKRMEEALDAIRKESFRRLGGL